MKTGSLLGNIIKQKHQYDGGSDWLELLVCLGLTLQGNVFIFFDYDWPLHRRFKWHASGCHGKLSIDSLCGSLRAESPYAMLIGDFP